MAPRGTPTDSPKPGAGGSYFLASAFMSQNQEVRLLMRPPTWSALPLFGSGTKTRISVPAVIPKTGDTYRRDKDTNGGGQRVDWGVFQSRGIQVGVVPSALTQRLPGCHGSGRLLLIMNSRKLVGTLGKNKRMSRGVL